MKSFAFIVTPTNITQLKQICPALKLIPSFILKAFFKGAASFKAAHLKNIKSKTGKEIEGYIIACPLFQTGANAINKDFLLDRIISACQFAQGLGVGIIGLDRYAASIADGEFQVISKRLKIPVTSGHALTAWSIFEAIYRMTRLKKINLQECTLAIIDAVTPEGNLCARKAADYVRKIIIVAKERNRLEQLQKAITDLSHVEVAVETEPLHAMRQADIIINTDGAFKDICNENLRPNAIFCDLPLSDRKYDKGTCNADIDLIESGLIKLPFAYSFNVNNRLPEDVIYAPLAETMLLALEGKFTSYSLGEQINLDKLEEIADLSVRHGFEIWVPEAPLV